MPTDKFDDDGVIVEEGEGQGAALELTDREKAIASGKDPDELEPAAEEGPEEDDDGGTDAEAGEAESKDADGPPAWVDSVRDLAKSYGLDDSDLESFSSESEFRKTAAMLEKMAKREKPAEEKSTDKPDEKPGESEPADETGQDDEIELDPKKFEEDGYDDNTVNLVKAVAAQQKKLSAILDRLSSVDEALAGSEKRAETEKLHREIDRMSGRFGNSAELSESEVANREKLIESYNLVREAVGSEMDTATALRRAELVAFGEEVLEEEKAREREAYAEKVKRQSSKRRSVGRNTKPSAKTQLPGDAEDPVKAIANAPEIVKFWNELQES